MCLNRLVDSKDFSKEGVCYKVFFKRDDNTFGNVYEDKQKKLFLGTTYVNEKTPLLEVSYSNGQHYTAGYHSFPNLEDAITYKNDMEKLNYFPLVVIKCEYEKLTAAGTSFVFGINNKQFRCYTVIAIVTQSIKLVEVI